METVHGEGRGNAAKPGGHAGDRSPDGPWTRRVLELLEANPEVRSADLCGQVSMDQPTFKQRVRRLKELGLTESLERGYRLSPRGQEFLRRTGA